MTREWRPALEHGEVPLYLMLAEAILSDVASGVLAPGSRLPNQRDLASLLGTSVGTVTRAYQEAEARGAIDSTPGRGTYVRKPPTGSSPLGSSLDAAAGTADLSVAHPFYKHEPDLADALSSLARNLDVQRLLQYQDLTGNPRYHAAGLEWLTRCGIDAKDDAVVITSGAQHADLALILALTDPGELILADDITYPGFLSLAQETGRRVQGIAMDQEGMVPEALEEACGRQEAKALYLIPTLHNPTGILMPEARREALAEIADRYELQVIEDDTLRLLVDDPPPTLTSLLPHRSFFIGSLSKAVSGGLRLAFVRAPSTHMDAIRSAVGASVFMPAPLLVELGVRWIEDGTADHTVDKKRAESEVGQKMAHDILPEGSFRAHPRSFYLWLHLTEGWTSAEFEAEARRRGAGVAPSRPFTVDASRPPDAVRICLSAAEDRGALEESLRTLARMLEDPRSRTPRLL